MQPYITDDHPTHLPRSMLTVRLPTASTRDDAYNIVQQEVIRPLSRIMSRYSSCLIAATGVFAADPEHGKHVHLLIFSNKPLPTIDHRQPDQAQRWRNKLLKQHRLLEPQIRPGLKSLELTPVFDQTAAADYIARHYSHQATQELIFGQKILHRLLNVYQAA